MKTLVLVLSTRVSPYPALIRTIKQTWASVAVSDVATLFYYGGEKLEVRGDDLTIPVPDGRQHSGRRTVACFEHVLRHYDFDVVFRTNASSYVDLRNLRDYVRAHLTPRFYRGYIGVKSIPFASGSGYFLSRDLVELVVEQRSLWNHALVDDQALAELLARNGVRPRPAPRQGFHRAAAVATIDTTLFHFRCRTTSWRRLEDRRILLRVHRAFCAERGLPLPTEDRALRVYAAFAGVADVARRVVRTFRDRVRSTRSG